MNLIWRYVDEIKTFKILKNTYRIKCLFVFARYNIIKKETPTQVFSCEFCEISVNNFSYRTSWQRSIMSLIRSFKLQNDFAFGIWLKHFCKELFFLSSSLKEEIWSWEKILKALSSIWSMRLFRRYETSKPIGSRRMRSYE